MASSNRHWPSMFKSKPCNPLDHQWQHDLINPSSLLSGCHRNPYTSGIEERNPEPKPRWNPKPEQIRILEAIFNSGMVNPPRDEIRKIRVQLQEFGQVGDANVFYWFQNRKSRSKNKNRQPSKNQKNQSTNKFTATPTMITKVPSSSSSSSDKSSSKLNSSKTTYSPTGFSLGSCSSSQHLDQLPCSPTASVNQTYDQLVQKEPFMFPMQQQVNFSTQGFTGFPDHQAQHQQMMMLNNNANNDLINIPHSVGPCTEFLFNELINNSKKDAEDEEKLMMMKLGYAADPSATSSVSNNNNVPVSDSTAGMPLHPTLSQIQGADHSSGSAIAGPMKSTVLINDVAFDVNCGPFHVREAFGNDAVLLHSTGQPVLTDEWGVTLQPLLHGAFYYLI